MTDRQSPGEGEQGVRYWRCVIDCPVHGRDEQIVGTYGGQRPREILITPPTCFVCADENRDGDWPVPRVVSIEATKAPA